ncbi:hypothetical protein C0993_011238 [Termitomyces sp. T159_Od127]|nr:hypothetical protein C0993_011238 [Termitomyces sp. T159_Od127]
MSKQFQFKLVLLGESAVGKSSLVLRFVKDQFDDYRESTIGARTWIRELQRQADPSIIIALCGNKSDLSARRQVSEDEAKKYADEEGLMWAETSAKTGEGVTEIFTAIGEPFHLLMISTPPMMSSCSQEAASDSTAIGTRWRRTRSNRAKIRCRPQQAGTRGAKSE